MSSLPFLKIIMNNTFRNRSRLFGSTLGALIAVSFITGSFLTVNAMADSYLQDKFDDETYHISFYGTGGLIDNEPEMIEDKIMEIRGIDSAGFTAGPQWNSYYSIGYDYHDIKVMALTERSSDIFIDEDITLFQDGRNITISHSTADKYDLETGDLFNISIEGYDKYLSSDIQDHIGYQPQNVTMRVGEILAVDMESKSSHRYDEYYHEDTIITGIEGLMKLQERLVSACMNLETDLSQYIYIKANPDIIDNVENPISASKDINRIEDDIRDELSPYGMSLDYNVIESIYLDFYFWSIMMKFLFMAMSMPLLLLSFYLLIVGSRIGIEDKRREVGSLKSKGASRNQIFGMLTFESIVLGFIGGITGLVIGILISKLFIAYSLRSDFMDEIIDPASNIPGVGILIFSLVVIPVVLLFMRFANAYRLSKIPLLETLKRSSDYEKESKYKGILDVTVLSGSLILVILQGLFSLYPPNNFFLALLYFILLLFQPLFILFLPFFLILSLTRVLIIGVPKVLELLSNVSRLIVKELHPLISSNLRFHKKRTSVMAVLVATSLAFGIMISVVDGSYKENIRNMVHTSVPEDVFVAMSGSDPDIGENITGISRVKSIVTVETYLDVEIDAQNYFYSESRLVSFDSSNYSKEISLPESVNREGKGLSALVENSVYPVVIINKAMRTQYDLKIGDHIEILLGSEGGGRVIYDSPEAIKPGSPDFDDVPSYYYEDKIDVLIGGVVQYLPGMRSTLRFYSFTESYGMGDRGIDVESTYETPAIYIDSSKLETNMTPGVRQYLIDSRGSPEMLADELRSLDITGLSLFVTTRDSQMEDLIDSPFYLGLKVVLDIEYFYVLMSVICGVSLMMIVTTASRRREFAEILSRGATRKQIMKMILSEGIIVLIAGLIVGTIVGILSSIAFKPLLSGNLGNMMEIMSGASSYDGGGGSEILLESSLVFPPVILLLHLLTVLSILGASLITSWLASRVDISNTLRLRTS